MDNKFYLPPFEEEIMKFFENFFVKNGGVVSIILLIFYNLNKKIVCLQFLF